METENDQIISSNNSDYNNATAIEIRLKTDHLLAQIEKQLRGYTLVAVYNEEGQVKHEKQVFGDPLANNTGIQEIMTFIWAIISPPVVSGNFKEDYFYDYIQDLEDTFSKLLIKNRIQWEMAIKGCNLVYNTFLFLVIAFISRLINDGERKSMTVSTHTQETNTVKSNDGFNLFGGKK